MAVFSGKTISARFIDPPNNITIEVLYQEGTEVVPYILQVDFTQDDFNDLLKEITLEEIQENTKNQIVGQRKQLFSAIDAEIERRWDQEQVKIKAAYDQVDVYAKMIIERDSENLKAEYAKIENIWKEIEKESGRIEGSWKEIEKESGRIKGSWKEIETYTEKEKSEFQKLRQELSSRFNSGSSGNKIEAKDILLQLINKDEDKDFVFNLKVAILEDSNIAKSKDKDMKLAIRKAKSVNELLGIYYPRKLD